MSNIDERVVEMQFKNKDFESGIKTSMDSLDKLKKGLELDKAAKSLNDLDDAGKKFSLAGIADGVESIKEKFSTLGIIGITVLQNLTNSAIEMGKNIANALVIQPITEGFAEYELKMDSVQTIMAGTGASLQEVNKYLGELNTYADRTIYSFSDMTSSIGKFTNAGVSLHDSVKAIQGVSNAAARSGANAQQASHAMYNFAQALSAGSIKLIDWKSIENANMATVEFKTYLLEAGEAAGTLKKQADGMYQVISKNGQGSTMKETISATKNFNDSLAYQWMTTEVLIDTLGDYADETTEIGKASFAAAQDIKTFSQMFDTLQEAVASGWGETFEYIIGDFHEAKESLTELSQALEKVIGESGDARNKMLSEWKALGGRTELIDGIRNALTALADAVRPVKEAFSEIFPPRTGQQLYELTVRFREFTEGMKVSEQTSANIKSTFKGLFAVLDIGKMALSAIGNAALEVVKYFLPMSEGILGVTASFGDFLVGIRDVIKETDMFNQIFGAIGDFLKPVADTIKIVIQDIVEAFKTLQVGDIFSNVINTVKNFVKGVMDAIASFRKVDTSSVDELGEKVDKGFRPFTAIAKVVKGAVEIIIKAFEKMAPVLTKFATAIGEGLGKAHEVIMNWLEGLDFNKGLDLFNSGIFAAILLGVKKFIDGLSDIAENGSGILDGIQSIMGGVTGTFEALQSRLKADVLTKIAIAIGILTAAVTVLSMLNTDQLSTALTAITLLFIELFGTMAIFEKVISGPGFAGIGKISLAMIAMSGAVLMLAGAVKTLADLSWEGLAKGLAGVGLLMAELILAVHMMPEGGKVIKGATGLVIFAGAIKILAGAVSNLAELNVAELTKGLVSVGVLLAELSIFLNLTDFDGMGMLKGVGIMALATSMLIFQKAIAKIAELDTDVIVKGLVTMGVLLTEIAIFTNMNVNAASFVGTSVGMTILAGALLVFTQSLKQMGGMSWEEIAKGLITLAGALTIISVALNLTKGSIGGAAAILVLSAALAVLTPILKVLGGMAIAEIGTALIAMAGTFAVLGGAAALLTPVIPSMLGLAAAVAALGGALALIGGGVLALSTGLAALAVGGTAGLGALVIAITSIIELVPFFIEKVAEGIVRFIEVIAGSGAQILEAVTTIITSVAEALTESIPAVVETIMTFLEAMLTAIVDFIPKLVDGGMKLILGILKGIADNMQKVVEEAIKVAVNFMKGITTMLPEVIDTGVKMIIAFINGLAEAIRGNTTTMTDAIFNLMGAVIEMAYNTLKAAVGKIMDVGEYLFSDGFIEGIKKVFGAITEVAKSIGGLIIDGLKGMIGSFIEVGADIIGGITTGIKNGASKVASAAKSAASNAYESAKNFLGINSPSKKFMFLGDESVNGLAVAMRAGVSKVANAAKTLGEAAVDEVSDIIDGIWDIITDDDDWDSNPVITPVLDLSNVTSGLAGAFAGGRTINASMSKMKASYLEDPTPKDDPELNPKNSPGGKSEVTNHFYINATIREEADIDNLSEQIYRKQRRDSRGRGVR